MPWVAKKLFARFNADEGIGLSRRGEMVAGVVYENWNGAAFTVHIVVDGLMTPRYLYAIFHYPFVHVGADALVAPVAPTNTESIEFVKHLGFREHTRLPKCHPDGSLILFLMERDECRFIGTRYREHHGKRQPRAARSA